MSINLQLSWDTPDGSLDSVPVKSLRVLVSDYLYFNTATLSLASSTSGSPESAALQRGIYSQTIA